jgi:hypothetical protein
MSNKTFDTLRLIEAVFVPLATFLIAMTDTWDVPHAAQLAATIAALNVCFGAIIEALRKIYNSSKE